MNQVSKRGRPTKAEQQIKQALEHEAALNCLKADAALSWLQAHGDTIQLSIQLLAAVRDKHQSMAQSADDGPDMRCLLLAEQQLPLMKLLQASAELAAVNY